VRSFRTSILVVVVLTLLSSVPIGVGADMAGSTTPAGNIPANALGAFVGYRWLGVPISLSAEWRVPRILSSSDGHASTWIGLQSSSGAFIQIGTTEDSYAGVPSVYAGFWSDDQVHFHPKQTFSSMVRPGDLMSATISDSERGWRMQIIDTRDHSSFVKTIAIVKADFSEAEWFQEDPTDEQTDSPLPYPRLSQVRLTKVKLNGRVPTMRLSNQVWMSVPGQDFAPTPLQSDSYTVVPVQLNPIQAQWVTAKASYDVAAKKFDDDEALWRTHPPSSASAGMQLQPFLVALNAYCALLASGSWPTVPAPDITALITAYRQDGTALMALANAEPRPGASVITHLARTRSNLETAAQSVTGAMGLP
jgi:peptidase A4-like protein